MAGVDDYVTVLPDGKKIDNDVLTIGLNQVYRQRTRIAGFAAGELADVRNADPGPTDYALVTRNIPSGTQAVSAASLPLPAGAATEATLAKLTLAQGASMAGALGPMVQAVVSDTPNSYIDGEVRPLSMSSEGRLRATVVQASTYLEFFPEINLTDPDDFNTMWAVEPDSSPWGL